MNYKSIIKDEKTEQLFIIFIDQLVKYINLHNKICERAFKYQLEDISFLDDKLTALKSKLLKYLTKFLPNYTLITNDLKNFINELEKHLIFFYDYDWKIDDNNEDEYEKIANKINELFKNKIKPLITYVSNLDYIEDLDKRKLDIPEYSHGGFEKHKVKDYFGIKPDKINLFTL